MLWGWVSNTTNIYRLQEVLKSYLITHLHCLPTILQNIAYNASLTFHNTARLVVDVCYAFNSNFSPGTFIILYTLLILRPQKVLPTNHHLSTRIATVVAENRACWNTITTTPNRKYNSAARKDTCLKQIGKEPLGRYVFDVNRNTYYVRTLIIRIPSMVFCVES